MGEHLNLEFGTWIDIGNSYLSLSYDKIPANGAWSGPGAEFLNFVIACIYLDRIKLDTSKGLISQIVATSQVLANGWAIIVPIRKQSLGQVIPLKTAVIESAQNRRATIRLRIYTLIANI